MQRFENKYTKTKTIENDDQFEARMYWFNNDFPSYNEVDKALNKYNGFTKRTAYCYGWDEIRTNFTNLKEKEKREDYLKREKIRTEKGYAFLDADIDNSQTVQTGNYKLYQLAMIVLGIQENPGIMIPDGFTIDHAVKIMLSIPNQARATQKQILRNAGMSESIKDNKIEHSGELTTKNLNVNTDAEVDEIYENRFKEFINTAFGNND